MSEQATNTTTDLLLEALPAIVKARPEGDEAVKEAYIRYHHRIDEVTGRDLFDEELVLSIGKNNAERLGLDTQSADAVLDWPLTTPLERGRAATVRGVWQGTGSGIFAAENAAIVHYINRPGIVEAKYGPSAPYILRKLGWSMLSKTLDWGRPDINPAYTNIRELLVARGLMPENGSLHIGATFVEFPEKQMTLHGSASGVLASERFDAIFHDNNQFAIRAELDRGRGLYEWEHDRRAGLYDVIFARQVVNALVSGADQQRGIDEYSYSIPSAAMYEGVDIN